MLERDIGKGVGPNHFLHNYGVTGGSEETGHVIGSKHYTDQAFDMWPNSYDKTEVFCCAVECGAQFAIEENKGEKSWHWHFQTPKGKLGSSGELPTKEECKCLEE